jgi:cysteine desulfurase
MKMDLTTDAQSARSNENVDSEIFSPEFEFSHIDPGYCDYNSTTPLPRRLIDVAEDAFTMFWANPSSSHSAGQSSDELSKSLHQKLSVFPGVRGYRATVTGSATEANNIAFRSALSKASEGDTYIISGVEHASLHHFATHPEWTAAIPTVVGLDENGQVDIGQIRVMLSTGKVKAIICQAANNETGVLHSIAQIAESKPTDCLLVVDASQLVGKSENWQSVLACADYSIVSPHKFHGPKGVGVLLSKSDLPLIPLTFGGGQEKSVRPGTENIPVFKLLDEWCLTIESMSKAYGSVRELRDKFEGELKTLVPEAQVLGSQSPRLCNTCAIFIPGMDSDALMLGLDMAGFNVATGSACHSGAQEPSHVFLANGLTWDEARCVIRISFGMGNQQVTSKLLAKAVAEIVHRTRTLEAN